MQGLHQQSLEKSSKNTIILGIQGSQIFQGSTLDIMPFGLGCHLMSSEPCPGPQQKPGNEPVGEDFDDFHLFLSCSFDAWNWFKSQDVLTLCVPLPFHQCQAAGTPETTRKPWRFLQPRGQPPSEFKWLKCVTRQTSSGFKRFTIWVLVCQVDIGKRKKKETLRSLSLCREESGPCCRSQPSVAACASLVP